MAESPLLEQQTNPGAESTRQQTGNANSDDTKCRDQFVIADSKEVTGKLSSTEILGGPDGDRDFEKPKMVEKIDVIGNVCGDFGKWQLRAILLIFLCKIPASWFMACIIYTAPAPNHGEFFCKPPSNVDLPNKTEWIKISHPQKEEADDKEFAIDFCNVYDDAHEHIDLYLHSPEYLHQNRKNRNSSIIPCDEFEHHADYHSLITQFDLVCSRDILVAVTQFFHLFGVLLGGIITTKMLDYISPRRVMLIGMFTQIMCGCLTGTVSVFEIHIFFRCCSAICCGLMYTAGQLIFTDITAGKYRTVAITLFEQFWSVGVILLPGVASFFSSWSHLYMAISLPTISLIFLHRWIPESPRWMISRGRIDDAKDILIQATKMNGNFNSLPRDLDAQLRLQAAATLEEPPPAGWWSIWSGAPHVKRYLICIHLAWSIYIVVYYGMLLNIRAFGREYLEVNTVIAGVCEIIGVFLGLYLILCTERKWLWTSLLNIFGGLVAYIAWIIPPNIKGTEKVVLLMATAMVSKITISSTLAILTTCSTEVVVSEKKKITAYSTVVWARIWLLCAPFVGATIIFGRLVPQTAFASLTILGALLTALVSSPRTWPKTKANHFNENIKTPEIWTVQYNEKKSNDLI